MARDSLAACKQETFGINTIYVPVVYMARVRKDKDFDASNMYFPHQYHEDQAPY